MNSRFPIATYIGVDPGASGAIAILHNGTLSVFDAPILKLTKGGKTRTRLDEATFFDLVRGNVALIDTEIVAVIEDVGGMMKQSPSAAFNFGATCGAMRMAFVAAGVRVHMTAPADWKSKARLIGKGKDDSRALAMQCWPAHRHLFARKGDDGRAEASLIAKFGAPHD